MASLFDGLPAPVNNNNKTTTTTTTTTARDAKHAEPPRAYPQQQGRADQEDPGLVSSGKATRAPPPYGQRERSGFVPRRATDYGDGGAFPEIHVAQYPRDLGRKDGKGKHARGQTLALGVSGTGGVDYGALHRQGGNRGKTVYADHSAIVPSLKGEGEGALGDLERPSKEAEEETKRRTMLALQGKVDTVLSASQPKHIAPRPGEARYVKYTPASGQLASGSAPTQRVLRISEAHVDPLEPPKFKHKKVPRGPGSPPVPVMHSPPRKLTFEDQQDWKIPPCISNWKNRKGYTIPLDKRLAADGRGLQEVSINDNFAKLSEALYVAEGKAREAIEMRGKIQREIQTKEKQKKEDELRQLAQKARMERAGLGASSGQGAAGRSSPGAGPSYEPAPAAEAGGDGTPDGAPPPFGGGGGDEEPETAEERDLRLKREELREERRRERERERRLEERQRHGFKRSKLTRDRDRDVSERVALGQAAVGSSASQNPEALYDQRLFNQDRGIAGGLSQDDAYNVYDKPLFADKGSSIYRPTKRDDDELYGEDGGDGADPAPRTGKFRPDKGFAGAEGGASAAGGARVGGPVQFEREEDPFDLEGLVGEVRGRMGRKENALDSIGRRGHMSAAGGGAELQRETTRSKVNFKKGSN